MKLAEIFSQLAYGELSQVVLGTHSEGELTEANYPALVSHINLGLTTLYKRFPLKEGRHALALQEGVLTYPLVVADLLKVERVYTEKVWELGLNDEADPYACFTPSAQTLRVPAAIVAADMSLPSHLRTSNLTVVYRANHPILVLKGGSINPATTEVELPYSHLEALLYFVASRVHNPIGMTNEFHAGNSWASKHEMECQKLETFNLRVDQGSQNTRLERNGWV